MSRSLLFLVLLPLLHSDTISDSTQSDTTTPKETSSEDHHPTVLLAILARSRAHSLPTWLGLIEQLNYPKSSIAVYIQTDHNQDNTPLLLLEWSNSAREVYQDIILNTSSHISYTQSLGPSMWEEERYIHMMRIRQKVVDNARQRDIRYVFFVDTDNFITNPDTLSILLKSGKTIVGPMLKVDKKTAYSNYWAGMTSGGYYKSVPEYFDILHRKTEPTLHPVPMVHSTLLIDLHGENADKLKYFPMNADYTGPIDDIIHFALTTRSLGIQMYIENGADYGYILSRQEFNTVSEEVVGFQEYLVDVLIPELAPQSLPVSQYVGNTVPEPDLMGFDEIYMISLERRPERRQRMLVLLQLMGVAVKVFDAVDGKKLDDEALSKLNVKQLDGYEDPYLKRPLKMGEIGCFLSHYFIWEEVVARNLKQVIVFEDDLRFRPNFKSELAAAMAEVKALNLEWDLIYLSRKILKSKLEQWVPRSSKLVVPHYSYWTAAYIVSQSGARKLLAQQPLQKMMAVDEYLPLMFDAHPNAEWMSHFSPRDLKAFSISPLVVEPQFYIGQTGYISDTELSTVIDPDKLEKGGEVRDEL